MYGGGGAPSSAARYAAARYAAALYAAATYATARYAAARYAAAVHQIAPQSGALGDSSLVVRPGVAAGTESIRASAGTLPDAIRLANAAAEIAVHRDLDMWARAIAHPGRGMNAISSPLAGILRFAGAEGADTAPQYNLHWNANRWDIALGWIALMCLFAVIAMLVRPKARSFPVFRLSAGGSWDADCPYEDDHTRIRQLPSLAGILMLPDSSITDRVCVRPVLSDIDANLLGWLTGRLPTAHWDIESANAAPDRTVRDFLITRCMDEALASRSAAIAIGHALSEHGVDAVIVDADFCATPAQREEMGLPAEMPGLAQILNGVRDIDDCLLEDEDYPGLAAIGAGCDAYMDPGRADDLLGSAEFVDVLDRLATSHTVVLVHGPSASHSAQFIAARVGATLLALPEEMSDDDDNALLEAIDCLSDARANLIGKVDICFDDRYAPVPA